MNKCIYFFSLILFLFTVVKNHGTQLISNAPITFAYNPKIANSTVTGDILYAGERPRYSATSGVVWVPGDEYLMSVHLFSRTLSIFGFDKTTQKLYPIRCLGKDDGILLNHPENLDISPDGKCLAISQGKGTIALYSINSETGEVYPRNNFLRYTNRDWVHGISFSRDGAFLAVTSIGDSSCICIYKLIKGKYKIYQVLKNKIRPLEPKGIAFSPDSNFLAACYCQTIGTNKTFDPIAQLEIYRFDPNTNLFDTNPISVFTKTPGNMETLKFSPDGSYLLTTDQVLDEVFIHQFNTITGKLLASEIFLKNPEAELNFPHGLAFSNDGKYIAVTNYGDDKITIYEL